MVSKVGSLGLDDGYGSDDTDPEMPDLVPVDPCPAVEESTPLRCELSARRTPTISADSSLWQQPDRRDARSQHDPDCVRAQAGTPQLDGSAASDSPEVLPTNESFCAGFMRAILWRRRRRQQQTVGLLQDAAAV
eukprot:gnl/TRDRNA2_/TRDRNA2_74192_c0_seq1.p1 gnl/TRDRNA2_/TRDRNA2_74192_c0~~gnl/TRDRNA2_/TRDRNA2_74192_c0_seq1.p1  ORF type:complete len:134 (-),score=24.98 gnl/TRDRNA2_/TRDRNA2_74192_c0_seq1:200-601(-)